MLTRCQAAVNQRSAVLCGAVQGQSNNSIVNTTCEKNISQKPAPAGYLLQLQALCIIVVSVTDCLTS